MTRMLLLSLLLVLGACGGSFHGVVAADHPLASRAGADILERGGNAVDAAVATSFALSVTRPFSCGIGGGGFMVIHLPDDPTHGRVDVAINYRETSPVGPDFYEGLPDEASLRGGTAVAIPGTVKGLLHALETHGTLDRATVLAPAIRLAREGFEADEAYVGAVRGLVPEFQRRDDWRSRFETTWTGLLHEGRVEVGTRIVNEGQAKALELIARDGDAAFYEGEIGVAIIRAIERDGGAMTPSMLASYAHREVEPLRFEAMGMRFVSMPPPSSGGVAIGQILGMMDRVDPGADDEWHVLAESMKHAFADRATWMADPAFAEVPVERLLSGSYLDDLASRIRLEEAAAPREAGSRPPEDGGTSHLSVLDRWGGAVACTETINTSFGSLLPVPEFGFCLNNEMDDFLTKRGAINAYGLVQAEVNLPEVGKRPLSSMSPTIGMDLDGRVMVISGASGGPRIISATVQEILHPARAGHRIHHQWSPNAVYVERAASDDPRMEGVIEDLESRGHEIRVRGHVGVAQTIWRGADGRVRARSDRRKGGAPVFADR